MPSIEKVKKVVLVFDQNLLKSDVQEILKGLTLPPLGMGNFGGCPTAKVQIPEKDWSTWTMWLQAASGIINVGSPTQPGLDC